MNKPTQIDIDAIFKEKAPKMRIPKFVISYVKRIAHQDEINQHFIDAHGKKGLDFTQATIDMLSVTCELENAENLPEANDGKKYIFASNHPLGGIDGMIILLLLGRKYGDKVRAFVNDILMYLEPMRDLFIPINKLGGGQGRTGVQMIDQIYESDTTIVTFPAGACSRIIRGTVQDFEWKKNFIAKAVKHQRDVVPIFFDGQNSKFYYRLSKWRIRLGIKTNLEMLYLADEMFKQRGKTVSVKIGKPIPWQTFDKSKTHTEWAAWVREQSYKLK